MSVKDAIHVLANEYAQLLKEKIDARVEDMVNEADQTAFVEQE